MQEYLGASHTKLCSGAYKGKKDLIFLLLGVVGCSSWCSQSLLILWPLSNTQHTGLNYIEHQINYNETTG